MCIINQCWLGIYTPGLLAPFRKIAQATDDEDGKFGWRHCVQTTGEGHCSATWRCCTNMFTAKTECSCHLCVPVPREFCWFPEVFIQSRHWSDKYIVCMYIIDTHHILERVCIYIYMYQRFADMHTWIYTVCVGEQACRLLMSWPLLFFRVFFLTSSSCMAPMVNSE